MTFVDYYAILEIEPTADADAVLAAVRTRRREWTQRQGHPSVDIRSRAEKMMQNIADAERTLTNGTDRARFDSERAINEASPKSPVSSARDWVAVARGYVDDELGAQANAAAREATTHEPDNAEAWYVRACASQLVNDTGDAIFAISEALRLSPSNAMYHCELGDLYAGDQWPQAQDSYQRASDLEPSNAFYRAGVASTYIGMDEPARAIPIYKEIVASHPEVELFQERFAVALLDDVVNQWSLFPDGTSSILTDAQAVYSREALSTVSTLRVVAPELTAHIAEIRRLVNGAEKVKWYGSDNIFGYLIAFAVAFIAFIAGCASGSGGAGVAVISLVIGVLIVFIFTKRHRTVGWKWQAKSAPAQVRASGLQ